MEIAFDKVYVISLITNKDRQKFIKRQFDELGIDFDFIYGIDYFKFKSVQWPNVYPDNCNKLGAASSFGCAIGHYAAVMQAYYLGYNNVLIIEDDVCLRTDKEIISDMLNNIPTNADFITFDPRFATKEEQDEIIGIISSSTDERYAKITNDNFMFGGAMYGIMNRNAMQKYMLNQQKEILAADNVIGFFKEAVVKRYVSKKCLFVDQFTYYKWFMKENYDFAFAYDNLYLRLNDFKKDDFFWHNNVTNMFFSRFR